MAGGMGGRTWSQTSWTRWAPSTRGNSDSRPLTWPERGKPGGDGVSLCGRVLPLPHWGSAGDGSAARKWRRARYARTSRVVKRPPPHSPPMAPIRGHASAHVPRHPAGVGDVQLVNTSARSKRRHAFGALRRRDARRRLEFRHSRPHMPHGTNTLALRYFRTRNSPLLPGLPANTDPSPEPLRSERAPTRVLG